ncbi:triphosphoribosyl-dephospho-CoA synthase [Candidatus Phytoplasma bonamiae]|uniref:triphosphoribosyl-dephospho-CoA synthase n=1 Tax=Candidatus Phytoplasma bonamiae TaxID=2982626 RepID=A0ABT9D7X6_9MOLU|nr:triphosphoribosyl-dephospho-CoA synthase ['Bonamia sp.' little leaf phytoplasma]MDO8064229.1 triphosphoribosyl-dephospho-CoA synthase ['Bonamia sp.' little leaf phytoplasma]MDV3174840.1 triphosphoribosyl-dephospho-CoA synthase ['Bonamia sp.' little leaf phytoplasma]
MKYLIKLALISIETELLCYPSLGLVSINNCGSHQDMNFNLFMKSKETFGVYFLHIYNLVLSHKSLNFNKLRILGIEQEKRMFKVTNNINTHKGLIFSFGIIYYVVSYCIFHNIPFSNWYFQTCQLTKELRKDFVYFNNKTPGEKLFKKFGITGARGEALAGYYKIFFQGLPFILRIYKKNPYLKSQEFYLCLLIFYMSIIEDTRAPKRPKFRAI